MTAVSVIILTLNEAPRITRAVGDVRAKLPESEIIVVDGGSTDGSDQLAARAGARLVTATGGRGPQCRAGAAAASGAVLLFLHADTHLPLDAAPVLRAAFARPEVLIGTFRLSFDRSTPFLRACAWLTRFDSVFTRFGDQGIALRREFLTALGGFPDWPLFEDVEFLRRARRRTRIWSFPASVITSARRFQRRGQFRQQGQNAVLLLRFLLGASPQALAAEYRPELPTRPNPIPT